MKHKLALAAMAVCALGVAVRSQSAAPAKDFTPREVAEIKALLAKANPSTYRVVLPVFRNHVRVGSETLGTLPVTEVRRIASLRRVTFNEKGNLQAIRSEGDASGGGGGGNEGNGPGSHINSGTPAKSQDLIRRIQLVVSPLEASRYAFVH